jgi:hypothetical protein
MGAVALVIVGAILGFGPKGVVTPSGSPGATASVPPSGEAWAAIGALPPLQPLATLTPARADAAGIEADTAFTLGSLTTTSAQDLAAGLTIEPAVALRVTPGADATSAVVTPAVPLDPGSLYHFRLTSPDGALAGQWAFEVKAPLHVVTALPGDRSTGVPTNTGIELTFDQDGVVDAASHFTIEPAVKGRFETHGRTLVFVPAKLELATIYTVTLSAGVGVTGSDVRLEQDVRIRFETVVREGPGAEPFSALGRSVFDVAPDERAVISVQVGYYEKADPGSTPPPTSLPVEVYRLPDAAAALKAARLIVDGTDWASTSTGLVPTAGLTRVMDLEGKLLDAGGGTKFIRLPDTLSVGAYLVVVPRTGRDLQALLQVTSLASYTLVTTTRSVVWTNTIGGGALPGVKVAIGGGAVLGRTDARGLLIIDTPDALDSAGAPVLLTLTAPNGEQVLVPVGSRPHIDLYLGGICCGGDDPLAQRWWSALSTDRILYRQTDTVNLWGYLRDRDTNTVPARAEVRLVLADQEYGGFVSDSPPIASLTVTPRASGAFSAALPLSDAPLAAYVVQVVVDGRVVAGNWITVGTIRKPAYKLEIALDRHVFIVGESVQATVTARFFEGTVAPEVPLSISAPYSEDATPMVTGPDGIAVASQTMRMGDNTGYESNSVSVGSAGDEEGSSSTYGQVLVFPATAWIQGTARLNGSQLTASGTVNQVDVSRLEAAYAASGDFSDVDPRGAAIAGKGVKAVFTELVPVRRLVGQRYDFIAKKTVLEYEYDTKEVALGSTTLTTDSVGHFSLARTIPDGTHEYRVGLTIVDADGKTMRIELYTAASAVDETPSGPSRPYLGAAPTFCGGGNAITFGVGETTPLTMRDGFGSYPTGGGNAYLFTTAQRGLREVVLQASPTLARTFTAADAPNLQIQAVRFTGRTYLDGAGLTAGFKATSRQLTVQLSADAARYRPGGTATVTVKTTDRAGHATPATVTLRGVDEKIYAIGGAVEEDPLGQLYAAVNPGYEASYGSHAVLWPPDDGGCGGSGGIDDDGRDDFRDTLLYRQFETGADGIGTVTFRLSDDLTSWHMSAAAVTGALQAGVGSLLIPVGLPFFVEPSLAPEYLLGDRPAVRLRAFGSDLHTGDAVTFTVASGSLGMPATTVTGKAFEPVDVPLPALRIGDQALTISGSTANGTLSDRLTRHFTVVDSRLMRTETRYATLAAGAHVEGGAGLTTYVFSDAGRGHFLPVLEGLAWGDGARLDQALAAVEARKLLASAFGVDVSAYPDSTFDPSRYQQGDGIALLPYSSPSLELAVRAALAAPGAFDQTALRNAMQGVLGVEHGATRERRIEVLVVLAALGDAVLPDVRAAAAATDLSVTERLHLALAAATLGDGPLAAGLERALLAEYGQRLGPWIRIRAGGSPNGAPTGTPHIPDGLPSGTAKPSATGPSAAADDATIEMTALWALVAVEVGDPYADEAEAYVEANPANDDLSALQQLAYARRAIERTPAAAASFAYTVDGTRAVVSLDPGASRTLTLTAPQRATLQLEPISGEVAVATTWRVALDPATVTPDPNMTLKRTVTPAGAVLPGQVVKVDLQLTFANKPLGGACTDVVDMAPSGLEPLAASPSWLDPQRQPPAILSPYLIAGQKVAFCGSLEPGRISVTMRYFARVVTPGTYVWEPASAQSTVAKESITLTGATTIELR